MSRNRYSRFAPWDSPPLLTYAIQCAYTKRTKIGQTGSPVQRFRQLQLQSPTDLRLLGRLACEERFAHVELAHWRLHGEWFEDSPDVRDFLGRFLLDHPVALAQIRDETHLPWYPLAIPPEVAA